MKANARLRSVSALAQSCRTRIRSVASASTRPTFLQRRSLANTLASKLYVYGNLGLGILTAPLDRFTQNDVLLYGLAATYEYNERLTFVGEVNGRYSTRKNAPRGTESDGAGRVGARIKAAGLLWDVAGIKGINKHSERSGLTFGVTYQADLFTPVK